MFSRVKRKNGGGGTVGGVGATHLGGFAVAQLQQGAAPAVAEDRPEQGRTAFADDVRLGHYCGRGNSSAAKTDVGCVRWILSATREKRKCCAAGGTAPYLYARPFPTGGTSSAAAAYRVIQWTGTVRRAFGERAFHLEFGPRFCCFFPR